MPQINRIRVNNVKYNFGTQVYDDFMMRFHCSNTIYDLANGGGKSLLMLLLLQTVIPNCTLDEKQPIEKLFRPGCGNTVIHSLVEWKLDSCYQKDQYKYMTTGFCARKGSGNTEDTDTEVAGEEAAQGIPQETASVEYFNYCIFYREFGDNDIKNLPLVSNGERITYNGLKAYLRELEKKDFSVSVKIFDRKGDYQSFISQYGLFESEWEIVRGINKTEGHVRTYFETNYRTSRKVVEDLLIEEIIQKSFNNRLAVDNDEGKMAKTLLDIKDKLVELSKKHAQIGSYDNQMAAIDGFAEYVQTYEELYTKKERLQKTLFDMLLVCKKEVGRQEEKQAQLDSLLEKMKQELVNEQSGIQVAEILSEKNSLKAITDLIHVNENEKATREKEYGALKAKLVRMESANDYYEYQEFAKSYDEITQTINNRMRAHSDILEELKCIAGIYHEQSTQMLESLQDKCRLYADEVHTCQNKAEEAKAQHRETDKKLAAVTGLIAYTEQEIKQEESDLADMLSQTGLLVAENASQEAAELKAQLQENYKELADAKSKYETALEKLETCKESIAAADAVHALLEKEQLKAAESGKIQEEENQRLKELVSVYGTPETELLTAVLDVYKKIEQEYNRVDHEAVDIGRFIQNAENGTYECEDPLRNKLKNYLETHYGEDVVEGHAWFSSLNQGQKRDVFKRAPFAEYGFIIKNDFERIRQDRTLLNFQHGAYAIPVISEQILLDTKLEVNKELIVFAMKDMSFLREDSRREAEVRAAKEELETLQRKLAKIGDRCSVVWSDYTFIMKIQTIRENTAGVDSQAQVEAELTEQTACKNNLLVQKERLVAGSSAAKVQTEKLEGTISQLQKRIAQLETTAGLEQSISAKYNSLSQHKADAKQAQLNLTEQEERVRETALQLDTANSVLSAAKETLDQLQKKWESSYQPFFEDGYLEALRNQQGQQKQENVTDSKEACAAIMKELELLSADNLESRFIGLKAVLDGETADVSDKERLKSHYYMSKEKCRKTIEYRGTSFEEIAEDIAQGKLKVSDNEELLAVKQQLLQIEKLISQLQVELDAQNALMNRLEGSISHGISQIEDKFGVYQEFDCDNPESFITQHKELTKKLSEDIKELEVRIFREQKAAKDIFVMEKDLERIVKNAGMQIPETEVCLPELASPADVDITKYETVQKEYDAVVRLEFKKQNEFEKYKQKLIEVLNGCFAQELSQEIRVSVTIPENVNQTRQTVQNLKETNLFIQLEKERIAKGIEDMERIKDNFENRCIQTCSNMKAELDRLPKLSSITMEDEVISMIGLQIPYVREELYKERMSAYIDETIVAAESFQNAEERLKYIRNRLTWKRLFSVIVTDMNSIRLNLYKRERIKDQSRYLKYEEAVGSTGQSQGIYIQFLIAIINYISSINAATKENTLIGKAIFIDNPFGAAKDIYIWEPIFKLLKTNHVQLIVPARGATPAITGRFDVNYILGQKLADKRQQTVVVNYYSNTKDAGLEYTRMDYEQTSFDFG